MRYAKILMGALAALLAVSGLAAAQDVVECPECDEDVPANDDCRYSSVDTGYLSEDYVELVDTDACVSKEGDERGFWAVFSLCLTQIVNTVCGAFGFFLTLDLFVSEEGMDLDVIVSTPLGDIDFDDTPLGNVDDETWNAVPDQELPEVPLDGELVPETGMVPDGVIVNECVVGESLELASCG